MFVDKDIDQILKKGMTVEKINQQLDTFRKGVPYVSLVDSATIDNGILPVSEKEKDRLISLFETKKDELRLLKFVPASGAATRMFKSLFSFLHEFKLHDESFNAYVNRKKAIELRTFFAGIEKLPFYVDIMLEIEQSGIDFENLTDDEQKFHFVHHMLSEEGKNFGNYPKGLLPFHKYKTHNATAFEEHLYEAALYNETRGDSFLHFTISEAHEHKFDAAFDSIRKKIEQKTGVHFIISFSFQKESTDTISVCPDGNPFRNKDGSLFFRPSGHGALLENLREQEADIIFIKNIDNVVVFKYKHVIADYKKMLAGKLLELQKKAFEYADLLDNKIPSVSQISDVKAFLEKKLNVDITSDFEKYSEKYKIEYLKEKINRPIRVCGMVKNEGEPGGGPFWIKDAQGNISLQIIESAQVDMSNQKQQDIFRKATHFNPVDLVCGIKNYKGEKYNLLDFTDPKQSFITRKTSEGKMLRALELPGLWNGSMAFWNTVFIEVPLLTFNPVKTVNDLLKSAHQVK